MSAKKVKTEFSSSSSSSSTGTDSSLVVELTKPGQRYPMESRASGDFVFYQTLYKENPNSNMALVWCIEHGVFSHDEAATLQEKYLSAKKQLIKLNRSGLNSETANSSGSSSSGHRKKKKRKVYVVGDGAVDAGMPTSTYEGIGSMGGM